MLALARLGGRGSGSIVINTASSQVYVRLKVSMGDVPQDGFLPTLPGRSDSETSSPDDNVHPQISSCGERFAALHLVLDS